MTISFAVSMKEPKKTKDCKPVEKGFLNGKSIRVVVILLLMLIIAAVGFLWSIFARSE